MKAPITNPGVARPRLPDEIPVEQPPSLDLWPSDAGNESLYHDRRFTTLSITDEGVREASAGDFLLGPPIQRMVLAIQDFDAWHALPVFLLAGFCLTSLDTTAKYLVRDHSLFLVVWARYLGQMLIAAPIAWKRCGPGFWRTRRLPMQLLRSVMLLGATACFFCGLRYLPLAEGSAILFLAPVFIVMFSGRVLGERPTRARWIASITGFAGVLVLLRPGSAIFHPAALLMFGAALCNAFYHMLTRKLTDDDAYTTLFYSGLVGTIVLSFMLPWGAGELSFTMRDGGLFLLLGLFAGLGHWLLIAAYVMAPASSMTPFTYVQMIWALMYGYVIFGQLPDRWSAVGIAVIVLSGVVLAIMERRRSLRSVTSLA
jgi:drug/metabolite transporter (DMT)-like permease